MARCYFAGKSAELSEGKFPALRFSSNRCSPSGLGITFIDSAAALKGKDKVYV